MAYVEIAQNAAWHADYLQGDFMQAKLLDNALADYQDGVCMATCAYWIAHHAQYRTFGVKRATSVRLDFLRNRHKFAAICRQQGTYEELARGRAGNSNSPAYATALDRFVKAFGLALTGQREHLFMSFVANYTYGNPGRAKFVQRATPKFEDLATFLNQTHTYNIINFDGVHPHSICCYKSGGKKGANSHLYVFDPNRGEFKVPEGEIDHFFANLLYEYIEMEGGHSSITALRVRNTAWLAKV